MLLTNEKQNGRRRRASTAGAARSARAALPRDLRQPDFRAGQEQREPDGPRAVGGAGCGVLPAGVHGWYVSWSWFVAPRNGCIAVCLLTAKRSMFHETALHSLLCFAGTVCLLLALTPLYDFPLLAWTCAGKQLDRKMARPAMLFTGVMGCIGGALLSYQNSELRLQGFGRNDDEVARYLTPTKEEEHQ